MRNRLTFANVIGVLLENKKKTYPQHLLNADVVFRDVMNENPDNDYSKSTARYLYSLYMRWGKKELAEQYKKSGRYIPANSQLSIRLVGYPPSHYPLYDSFSSVSISSLCKISYITPESFNKLIAKHFFPASFNDAPM